MLYNFDHLRANSTNWIGDANTWSTFGTGKTGYLEPIIKYLTPIKLGAATRFGLFEKPDAAGVMHKGILFEFGIGLRIKPFINKDVLGFRLTGNFTDAQPILVDSWNNPVLTATDVSALGNQSLYLELTRNHLTGGMSVYVGGNLIKEIPPTNGITVEGVAIVGGKYAMSDVYHGTMFDVPLGNLKVVADLPKLVTNPSNLEGYNTTLSPEKELGVLTSENGECKSSYLLLKEKDVESNIEFDAVSGTTIASCLQVMTSRGLSCKDNIVFSSQGGELTPLEESYLPVVLTETTQDSKQLLFRQNTSSAEINSLNYKVKF